MADQQASSLVGMVEGVLGQMQVGHAGAHADGELRVRIHALQGACSGTVLRSQEFARACMHMHARACTCMHMYAHTHACAHEHARTHACIPPCSPCQGKFNTTSDRIVQKIGAS